MWTKASLENIEQRTLLFLLIRDIHWEQTVDLPGKHSFKTVLTTTVNFSKQSLVLWQKYTGCAHAASRQVSATPAPTLNIRLPLLSLSHIEILEAPRQVVLHTYGFPKTFAKLQVSEQQRSLRCSGICPGPLFGSVLPSPIKAHHPQISPLAARLDTFVQVRRRGSSSGGLSPALLGCVVLTWVFQLDDVSRPLWLWGPRSLTGRMGWLSCTCPLVTGELVFREAGVNLKGRWVGEERFSHYVFLAPNTVSRDKGSGMHFWNAPCGFRLSLWRVLFKNGHPGSGGLGTGLGQQAGTDETINAGLQINSSPVCLQRNLVPFP